MKEKEFYQEMFKFIPYLKPFSNKASNLYNKWSVYQNEIPRAGAIILTPDMNDVLVVLDYKGTSYSFPRGKINENEELKDCAVREVKEEIGFDISPYLDPTEYITIETRPKTQITLFICRGVPKTTLFEAKTRKEISRIEWFNVQTLMKNMVLSSFDERKRHLRKFMFLLTSWIDSKNHNFDVTDDFKEVLFEGSTSKKNLEYFTRANREYFSKKNVI